MTMKMAALWDSVTVAFLLWSTPLASAFCAPIASQKQRKIPLNIFATEKINLDGVEEAVHNLRLELEEKELALEKAQGAIQDYESKQTEFLSNIQALQDKLKEAKQENVKTQKDLNKALNRISHLEKKFDKVSKKTVIPKISFKLASQKPDFPEISGWRLTETGEVMGTVTNHPSIKDGDEIITSVLADPNSAAENKVVVTTSGSKYQLGEPYYQMPLPKKPIEERKPKPKPSLNKNQWKKQLGLTGDTIGNGKYVLAGKPKKSTNERCFVWTCYATGDEMEPTGEALAVKISPNKNAMKREWANLNKFWSGVRRGAIINGLEFLPVADSSPKFADKCALVMERGTEDLKEYRSRTKLQGQELKDALQSAVLCMEAVHGAKMVWTDLKSENFILVPDENDEENVSFKAIDLESAMPVKGNPLDYTPEACPPEFAQAFKEGDAHDFVLEYNYDIWSFGMLAYELSTGEGFFDGWTPETIMNGLADDFDPPHVENIKDEKLADLISQCLSLDPKRRPSVLKISKHSFFGGSSAPKNIFGW